MDVQKLTLEEAARNALETLERYQIKRQDFDRFADEIEALRAALAESRPHLSDEHMRALRESHMYDSEQRYFEPRPVEDGAMQRKAFYAGFERGWDASAALNPPQPPR